MTHKKFRYIKISENNFTLTSNQISSNILKDEKNYLPSEGKCSTNPGAKLSGSLGVDKACRERAKLGGCGGGALGAMSIGPRGNPEPLPSLMLLLAPGPEVLVRLVSSSGLVSLSNEF